MLDTNATVITPIMNGLARDYVLGQTPPSSIVYAAAWVLQQGRQGSGRALCGTGFHWASVRARSATQCAVGRRI